MFLQMWVLAANQLISHLIIPGLTVTFSVAIRESLGLVGRTSGKLMSYINGKKGKLENDASKNCNPLNLLTEVS